MENANKDSAHTCSRCGYVFEPLEEGACPRCRHMAEIYHAPPDGEDHPARTPAASHVEIRQPVVVGEEPSPPSSRMTGSGVGNDRNIKFGICALVFTLLALFAWINPNTMVHVRHHGMHLATPADRQFMLFVASVFVLISCVNFVLAYLRRED